MENYSFATVRYIGDSCEEFTYGKEYEAFFLEYWQGKRDSLHVRENSGSISDFNDFSNFIVIQDDDNVLNKHEAIVQYIGNFKREDGFDLTFGKLYKAIAKDKQNYYLVMDDSSDCYYYHQDYFKVIEDKHGVLSKINFYTNYGI